MKIGLTGPSGSGKTTLAHFISNLLDYEFIAGSASITHEPEAKRFLNETYNYVPQGHRNVINQSNINPKFGFDFQRLLLESRISKLSGKDNFVTDRTPLDNASYFLMQCAHNQTEQICSEYLSRAIAASDLLTHLIIVKPNESWTENNDSRVDNNFYQHLSYAVFKSTYERYFEAKMRALGIKVLMLEMWDLAERKQVIKQFLGV